MSLMAYKDGDIIGINRRCYNGPGWVPTEIIVVLVSGTIGDYAAYISAGNSTEWCKRHGNKLSFDEACIHFPGGQLKKENYRE